MITHANLYYTVVEDDRSYGPINECLEDAAETAASDYHHHHNGWESSWPLTFIIFDENRNELGRWMVEREARPVFCAERIKGGK